MLYFEHFTPGSWINKVDTNDFMDLNGNPFSDYDFQIESPKPEHFALFQELIRTQSQESISSVPYKIPQSFYFDNLFDSHFKKEDEEQFHKIFDLSSTHRLQKALSSKLLSEVTFPNTIIPDIRRIPLYGTKRLINEKKNYLKQLDTKFQSTDWYEEKLSIHRQILALKKFEDICKSKKINVSKPSNSSKNVIETTYLTLLFIASENPFLPIDLPNLSTFFDVFIQLDIQQNKITEEDAQFMINEFVLALQLLSAKNSSITFSETVDLAFLSKSSACFMNAVEHFSLYNFPCRFVFSENEELERINQLSIFDNPNHSITFIKDSASKNHTTRSVSISNSIHTPSEESILKGATCDLLKVLEIAVNGGKDTDTNANLYPISSPLSSDHISYEEAWSRFIDYIPRVMTLNSELANAVYYLSETHFQTPFRFSLTNEFTRYNVVFTFKNIEGLASIFDSMKNNNYTINRNSKNAMIAKPMNDFNFDTVREIANLIQNELFKLPLYKNGHAKPRFILTRVPTTSSLPEQDTHFTFYQSHENLKDFRHIFINSNLSELRYKSSTK